MDEELRIAEAVAVAVYLGSLSQEEAERVTLEAQTRAARIEAVDFDAFVEDLERYANEGSKR